MRADVIAEIIRQAAREEAGAEVRRALRERVAGLDRPAHETKAVTARPAGVRGRFSRSRVETRNISPAPSASDPVMIGVCK